MESWIQVIIEWINCLNLSTTPVKEIVELEDKQLCRRLICLLPWAANKKDSYNTEDFLTEFIKDVYPEFKIDNEEDAKNLSVHVPSLLLLYVSQEPTFQEPMCSELRYETQIRIKTFLEALLPYHKVVTKDILNNAILEAECIHPRTPEAPVTPKTPMTPKMQSLKDFFNSPVIRSTQNHKLMVRQNRELRQLRSELEVERFEKADLEEDIRIQQNKIESLQKELQEKSKEIRKLRDQWIMPSTPQSCRKNQSVLHSEEYYKKEIEGLESELIKSHLEQEKLEVEKNTLSKKVMRTEQQYSALKEKYEHCDKSLESLLLQIELRDKELLDLKLRNTELRTYLSELSRKSLEDQSNELEDFSLLKSPAASLNNSEVLSCVIEIQLQEAKEEACLLRNNLHSVTERLKFMIQEHREKIQNSSKDVESVVEEACPNLKQLYNDIIRDSVHLKIDNDNKVESLLSIVQAIVNELHFSRNMILQFANTKTTLEEKLSRHKETVESNTKLVEENQSLRDKMQRVDLIEAHRREYLDSLVRRKESLQESLQQFMCTKSDLDSELIVSKEKWRKISDKIQNVWNECSSACNEQKELLAKKAKYESTLCNHETHYSQTIQFLIDTLWKNFIWTESELRNANLLCLTVDEDHINMPDVASVDYNFDQEAIELKLEKNRIICSDIAEFTGELDSFFISLSTYESNCKHKHIEKEAKESGNGSKLTVQIDQLLKENKDLKSKLDTTRSRNVKLEKNMDELRTEIKKIKTEKSRMVEPNELENLKKRLQEGKEQNIRLCEEKDKLHKQSTEEFDDKLKEMRRKYEIKLEEMKQKMKTAYNEQVEKLNDTQEKILQEKLKAYKVQMEQQCHKYSEEIDRYKAHVNDLSSQFWTVGEKLLTEQQQKQKALEKLNELSRIQDTKCEFRKQMKSSLQQNISKSNRQHSIEDFKQDSLSNVEDTTFERRHSIKSMQVMSNAFTTADEKGEVFDNIYLADIIREPYTHTPDMQRLSILQMRNSLCKPHLKSSYPAETQFHPSAITEEEIKTGLVADDVFNDSPRQSLLPEQKPKKRVKTQISYKKPGPPTPSKNGGKLSLQGNELRSPSSRILKEKNIDRRTTATPRTLKHLFSLKRQDENVPGTSKGPRISGIFRKSRTTSDR